MPQEVWDVPCFQLLIQETIASALGELVGRRALVVSSADGLDEISCAAETRCVELRDGAIESFTVIGPVVSPGLLVVKSAVPPLRVVPPP